MYVYVRSSHVPVQLVVHYYSVYTVEDRIPNKDALTSNVVVAVSRVDHASLLLSSRYLDYSSKKWQTERHSMMPE